MARRILTADFGTGSDAAGTEREQKDRENPHDSASPRANHWRLAGFSMRDPGCSITKAAAKGSVGRSGFGALRLRPIARHEPRTGESWTRPPACNRSWSRRASYVWPRVSSRALRCHRNPAGAPLTASSLVSQSGTFSRHLSPDFWSIWRRSGARPRQIALRSSRALILSARDITRSTAFLRLPLDSLVASLACPMSFGRPAHFQDPS